MASFQILPPEKFDFAEPEQWKKPDGIAKSKDSDKHQIPLQS